MSAPLIRSIARDGDRLAILHSCGRLAVETARLMLRPAGEAFALDIHDRPASRDEIGKRKGTYFPLVSAIHAAQLEALGVRSRERKAPATAKWGILSFETSWYAGHRDRHVLGVSWGPFGIFRVGEDEGEWYTPWIVVDLASGVGIGRYRSQRAARADCEKAVSKPEVILKIAAVVAEHLAGCPADACPVEVPEAEEPPAARIRRSAPIRQRQPKEEHPMHQVETMSFSNETPWHGLGYKFLTPPTKVEDAMQMSGLDWQVELQPLSTPSGLVAPAFATVRTSDNSILGVVGTRFVPLQNSEAFDVFQPLLDEGFASFESAGSLNEGKRVWVLAKIAKPDAEVANGDLVSKYCLLSHGHDGTAAVSFGVTPVRVVCANTLALASECQDSVLLRVVHTKNARITLEKASELVQMVDTSVEESAKLWRKLAKKQISPSKLDAYFADFLGLASDAKLASLKGKMKIRADRLLEIFESGRDAALKSAAKTWWDAYNAVTEFLSHEAGKTQNGRVDSLWFGKSHDDLIYAHDQAVERSGIVATSSIAAARAKKAA